MSIGQSIIASTSGFIIFLILGLVMAPMLILVPLAILVLIFGRRSDRLIPLFIGIWPIVLFSGLYC